MEYQLFEILLLFAFYSIIGWVTEVFGFALSGGGYQNRGVCRGPYLIAYGLGALAVLYGADYIGHILAFGEIPALAAVYGLGFSAGLILGLLSMAAVNGLSGKKIIRLRWYQPFLCGFGAVILIAHLNPLLTAYIRWAPPWLHMVFLLIFWTGMPAALVDGLDRLMQLKKNRHISQKDA